MNNTAQLFVAGLMEEVKELSSSPFGSTLLGTIGLAYQEAASSEMDTLTSFSVGFTQATRYINSGLSIASQGIRAAYTASEMNSAAKASQAKAGSSSSGGAEGKDAASAAADDAKGGERAGTGIAEAKTPLTAAQEAELQKKAEKLSGHMFAVM